LDKIFRDGLAKDPRPLEEKAKDYHLQTEDALLVTWAEKPKEQWKKYIPRYQDGSLSCVGQSGAKAMETFLFQVLSAHPPYRRRSNFPEGGMYLANIGYVLKNFGTCLEKEDVSQNINELKMDSLVTADTLLKIGGYFFVNPKIIEEVAEAIETRKHCMITLHCYKSEWTAPIPTYNGKDDSDYDFGHMVCAIDYFIHGGKKVVLVEDSTGHNTTMDRKGQRLLTEEFLSKRASGGIFFTPEIPVPPFKFTQTMRLGTKGDAIKKLQQLLNKELDSGLLVDGSFGPKTLLAVKTFQTKYNLVADGIAGPRTRAVLNLLI